MLRLKPISLRDANEYVRQHHRHHKAVAGHKFSIGCEADGELVGVIIAGRPISRYLDDGFTEEARSEYHDSDTAGDQEEQPADMPEW